MVDPHAQYVVGFLRHDLATAIAIWQPMAARVTMQGSRHIIAPQLRDGCDTQVSESSSTAIWASTRRLAWAHALTRCRGYNPRPRLWSRAHSCRQWAPPGRRSGQRPPAPSAESPPRSRPHPPRKDLSQHIVRGDPVGQFQEGAQPGIVELAKEGDGHETVGAADDQPARTAPGCPSACAGWCGQDPC